MKSVYRIVYISCMFASATSTTLLAANCNSLNVLQSDGSGHKQINELANGADVARVMRMMKKVTSFSYGVVNDNVTYKYQGVEYDGRLSCPSGGKLFYRAKPNDSTKVQYAMKKCVMGDQEINGSSTRYDDGRSNTGYQSINVTMNSGDLSVTIKGGKYAITKYMFNGPEEKERSFIAKKLRVKRTGSPATVIKDYTIVLDRKLDDLNVTNKEFAFSLESGAERVTGKIKTFDNGGRPVEGKIAFDDDNALVFQDPAVCDDAPISSAVVVNSDAISISSF